MKCHPMGTNIITHEYSLAHWIHKSLSSTVKQRQYSQSTDKHADKNQGQWLSSGNKAP